MKKEADGRSILHGGALNKLTTNDSASTNGNIVNTNSKFSPFRSQRNTSIGGIATNNAMAHNGMM